MKQRGPLIVDLGFTETPTALPSGAQLGTYACFAGRVKGQGEFVLGQFNVAITQYQVAIADKNANPYDFIKATQTIIGEFHPLIAIACATGADNDYGWFCTKHTSGVTYADGADDQAMKVDTAASTAAESVIYMSSTAGRVQSTKTTTQKAIDGLIFETATATTAAADNATPDFPQGMRVRDR